MEPWPKRPRGPGQGQSPKAPWTLSCISPSSSLSYLGERHIWGILSSSLHYARSHLCEDLISSNDSLGGSPSAKAGNQLHKNDTSHNNTGHNDIDRNDQGTLKPTAMTPGWSYRRWCCCGRWNMDSVHFRFVGRFPFAGHQHRSESNGRTKSR